MYSNLFPLEPFSGSLSDDECIQEDLDTATDKRTARFVRSVANTITPMIQMEEECPSNHPSGKMAILDL